MEVGEGVGLQMCYLVGSNSRPPDLKQRKKLKLRRVSNQHPPSLQSLPLPTELSCSVGNVLFLSFMFDLVTTLNKFLLSYGSHFPSKFVISAVFIILLQTANVKVRGSILCIIFILPLQQIIVCTATDKKLLYKTDSQ